MFRRRWDLLLRALDIPCAVGLTPASLRAGGAVKSYRSDTPIQNLTWDIRLKNVYTLQHYLQQAEALSIFPQLPYSSQCQIRKCSALFDQLIREHRATLADSY